MNSKRVYYLMLAAVLLLAVAIIGGTYGLNKLLHGQSGDVVTLRAQQEALSQEAQLLKMVKKDVSNYQNLEEVAKAVVPQDKDQAQTVRQIVNIAAASGVGLGSISFPSSTLGGTGNGGGGVGATGGVGAGPSKSLSQLKPVPNIPGVYVLEITIQDASPVTFDQLVNFLHGLEENRRTAQVSSINLSPSADQDGKLQFTIMLEAYIKP